MPKFNDTQELIPDELWSDDKDEQIKLLKYNLEKVYRVLQTERAQYQQNIQRIIDQRIETKVNEIHLTLSKRALVAIGAVLAFIAGLFSDKIKSMF